MNYIRQRAKPDYKIAILSICLAIFGIIMIASSSVVVAYEKYGGSNDYYFVWHQAIALIVGLIGMSFFSNFDYKNFRKIAVPLIITVLILLLAVFFPVIGTSAKGAHRWLNIGFSFQPSEIAKIAFVIYLSVWLDSRKDQLNKAGRALLPFALMLMVISALIILEPDLGTLSIIILTSIILFFAAGAPVWHIGSLGVFLVGIFAIFVRSASYRWDRFITFLNPSAESLGQGYHVNQAFIAVSQGGLWGKGFGQSLQKMRYLPEPHTDSIFAIICEELGFFRAAFLVVAFIYLFMLGLKIAKGAPDNFGRLLALGLTSLLIIQALVNLAAILGMVPMTGVTLPFISYGGTSMAVSLIQIGILLNISKQSQNAQTQ
ncbi:MAG: putative lipid II flippase FtsW [Candidatus Berkelbacteria bacterium]|nr:putative lipid II flippase FtsW [Candidatus Berkelbacteria bacterium]